MSVDQTHPSPGIKGPRCAVVPPEPRIHSIDAPAAKPTRSTSGDAFNPRSPTPEIKLHNYIFETAPIESGRECYIK